MPGDQFDMIVSYKRSANGEGQVGQVLYAGLDRGSTPVAELMRWGSGNEFYAADGLTRPVVTTQSSGLMMPVAGRITSSFGMRFHPILGYSRMHAGVDIGAGWGTPIRASAAGVVSFAGRHGGHGNYVRLEHGMGLGTGYGHMSSISVWPGSRVRAGAELVAVERHDESALPAGWDHSDLRLARAFGDAWIRERRTAVMVVPSVVARREGNVLINPQHPDFSDIVASAQSPAYNGFNSGVQQITGPSGAISYVNASGQIQTEQQYAAQLQGFHPELGCG